MKRYDAIVALLSKEEDAKGSFCALRCKDFAAVLSATAEDEASLLGNVAGTNEDPGVVVEFSYDVDNNAVVFRYVGYKPSIHPSAVTALCRWLEGEI